MKYYGMTIWLTIAVKDKTTHQWSIRKEKAETDSKQFDWGWYLDGELGYREKYRDYKVLDVMSMEEYDFEEEK